jgi:hypothetical protein
MTLVEQVSGTFAVDPGKAEKGIGVVLTAVRVTLAKDAFEKVKAAVPGAERYMGHALMSPSGRTAEMAPLAAPGTLVAALSAHGWRKDEIPRLVRLVLDHLRPVIGDAGIDQFLDLAPGLK